MCAQSSQSPRRITPQTVVTAIREQVSCDLAGEAAILDLRSGTYYGLDPVGARIWSLLKEPIAVAAIQEMILQEYEVEASQCESDLVALLHQLADANLIELRDPEGSPASA